MGRISKILVEPPGPKAREIMKGDDRYVATSTKTSPVAISHAKGGQVTDVDGNTFLDFASGVAVMNVGYSDPRIIKAVQDQAEKLFHFAGTDFYYDAQVNLAKKLDEVTPGDHEKKVFFSNSGTESVEAAMKLARWYSRRKQLIAFLGCFHGRTMGSLSMTSSKPVQRRRHFPTVPGVQHVPFANCYRCPYKHERASCGTHCAKVIEEVYFQTVLPPEEVAAMFIEPIQGEGGYIVPPPDFVREIAKICKAHGILLVDDEVQAGMGRTGKMWAIEHYGVVPDILCTSKSLGSGVPIGATVFPRQMDFEPGAHSNTFGGNLLACASSLATFDILESDGLVENAARMGDHLNKRLRELMEDHEIIGDVRGIGLMQATELVKDRRTKEYAVKERDRMIEMCFKRGLILLPAGRSTIRYIPPLTVDEMFIDEAIDILDSAFKELEK
ncbi:MAG: acetyl ornithine aminotransferase family protein [Methanomassiliicoccus sp.]|nr:acetyl ornithine aminotransferase family protein [Methanomassiliicoccus sp.]